jgi:hypothetical protein
MNEFFLVNVSSSQFPDTFAKISPQDAQKVLLKKWTYGKCGNGRYQPYVGESRTGSRLHRYVMDAPIGVDVDHINGDTLDNRRENLRLVTARQNQANSRKRKEASSKYKGVAWHPVSGKWRAYISPNGKQQHLGLFSDEVDAARAYDKRASEVFGPHASLNLPPPSKSL